MKGCLALIALGICVLLFGVVPTAAGLFIVVVAVLAWIGSRDG